MSQLGQLLSAFAAAGRSWQQVRSSYFKNVDELDQCLAEMFPGATSLALVAYRHAFFEGGGTVAAGWQPSTSAVAGDNSVYANDSAPPQMRDVSLQYAIYHIGGFDCVQQTVNVYFYIKVSYHEPQLAGLPATSVIDFSKLWNPGFYIVNGLKVEEIDMGAGYGFSRAGDKMEYKMRYRATLSVPMDLHNFPFDRQEIVIVISSRYPLKGAGASGRSKKYTVQFRGEANVGSMREDVHLGLPEWSLKPPLLRVRQSAQSASNDAQSEAVYSEAVIVIPVRRKPKHYVENLAIVALMVVLSWFCFFASPDDLIGRLGTFVTLFLAVVAFKFVLSAKIPNVPYSTVADRFVFWSFAYLVIGSGVSLASKLAPDPYIGQFSGPDFFAIIIYPTTYAILMISMLLHARRTG